GEYRIIREIGHGSMGIVFEARHDGLDRVVALKVLPPSLSVTETVIKRFMREAQSVAKLDHENIVRIYTTGEQDGVYYYAMQFIEGSPLDEVLKERKLSPTESAEITAQSARALFFAHEHSIIHRDVKPANIILSYKDRPVLTDFGLARPEKAATLTASGALVGTPIYMSPEQVRGDREHIDRRTDIYSLGVTFYEMLTGTTPFEAESTQEILNKIEYHEPRRVRKVRPEVPKALETICHKAIEKEAGRRYQTAIELALDLERFLNGDPIQARRTALHTRLIKKAVKHRTITTLGALLALAVVLVYFATRAGQADKKSASQAQYSQLLLEGLEHLRKGERTVAMQKYDQAIFLLPRVATAYVDRGKAFYTNEEHESALLDFGRALELDSDNVRARMWRNISKLRWGSGEDKPPALTDLQTMLQVSPDDTNLLLEVSRTLLEMALDAKAEE
ncbi:MAG: protein kinase, partial [Planctomycetota bacterium]